MTDRVVPGWDVTAANYNSRPKTGQAMLYGTGTPDIRATPGMIAENPWCVLVDQSPVITSADVTMDVYDMENGAITLNELAEIIHDADFAYRHKVRKGQRFPLVYASDSRVPDVIKILDSASLQGKCGLFPAHWGIGDQAAIMRILGSAGNPYPVMAMQDLNAGTYDRDMFSLNWLATSGQWNYSWTCHHQHWTLWELAGKLGLPVAALNPGNSQAASVVTAYHDGNRLMIIPQNAHFTYQKLPQ